MFNEQLCHHIVLGYFLVRWLLLGISLVVLGEGQALSQRLRTQKISVWDRPQFEAGHGGLSFRLYMSRKLRDRQIRRITVTLYRPVLAMHYELTYDPALVRSGKIPVWQLPKGDYKPLELEFENGQRQVDRWLYQADDDFTITANRLNEFGKWYAFVLPSGQLKVVLKKKARLNQSRHITNRRRPSQQTAKSNIKIPKLPSQRASSGSPTSRPMRQVPQGSEPDTYTKRRDVRIAYEVKRGIEMSYKIDLYRFNRYSPTFAQVLNEHDRDLRQCYLNGLEKNDNLQGAIAFKLLYSGKNYAIKSLKPTRSTIHDRDMIDCLYWQLLSFDFPIRDNFLGEIIFQFRTDTR